ncbi:MAG: DNA-3-methyladenine glycosylase 2 family protein [Gammaproteobacteria bacterium]|nr:DNA-3-methyladenine glycosylase 2 family protein [Gammaproteobacteria bacterium]
MSAVHRTMLRRAAKCLPSLRQAMVQVGPTTLSIRSDMPLSLYLCRSVVGQQLSGKAARTIWGRVETHVDAKGSSLVEVIRQDGNGWLRACGVSRSKSRAIASIFEAEDAGLLEAAVLARMDHASRSAQVSQVWGVGQWTCDMLSMFYFADPDIWPRADTSTNKVLTSFMQQEQMKGEAWEAAELFKPYRTYLAMYLWRIADIRLP